MKVEPSKCSYAMAIFKIDTAYLPGDAQKKKKNRIIYYHWRYRNV